jgi:hypothetical protein
MDGLPSDRDAYHIVKLDDDISNPKYDSKIVHKKN